jgi:hypothetical protein
MGTLQANSQKPVVARSKYEMNLAEFPFAFLTTKIPKGTNALEYQDTIVGRDGKEIQRRWKIYPHPKYGFPTPSTQATLFELFQIWAQSNFESSIIHFGSIYALIKRRGLQDDKRTYERIRRDLNLLVGVIIEAKDAFWDNEKKAYGDQTFHLFDMVRFYRKDPTSQDKSTPAKAYIEASKTLWGSIEASGLITLKHVDAEFFRGLTPIQQRLALYLGKMLYSSVEHRREIRQIAYQIPITAKSSWHVKEEITKACEGLISKGFPYLSGYRYERSRDRRSENIIFQKYARDESDELLLSQKNDAPRKTPPQLEEMEEARQDLLVEDIISLTGDVKSKAFYCLAVSKLSEETIRRGMAETRAAHLQNEIRTTRGRYFIDLVKRFAADQGVQISTPKKIAPETSQSLEELPLFSLKAREQKEKELASMTANMQRKYTARAMK